MTKTVRISPTKLASAGNPAVQSLQPATTTVEKVIAAAQLIASSASPPVSLPAKPNIPVTQAYVNSIDAVAPNRTTNDRLQRSSRTFTPYEQLVGITSDRPELLAMCQFLPLFEDDSVSFTDAALFLDAQLQLRDLRAQNVKSIGFDAKDALSDLIDEQRADFRDTVVDLLKYTQFLLSLAQRVDELGQQFDLRSDVNEIDMLAMVMQLAKAAGSTTKPADLLPPASPQKFDFSDVLVQLGFNSTNVSTFFSSTKLWLQLLYELKQMMVTHSPRLLDANVSQYTVDADPVVLAQLSSFQRFTLNSRLEMPTVDSIVSIDPSQLWSMIDSVGVGFAGMYGGVTFKSPEQRMSALCWELSREFRYSAALSRPAFLQTLQASFGYTPSVNGNQAMFDSVLGRFGTTALDVPAAPSRSLSDMAVVSADDLAIATFESKYVEGPNGTVTPGSTYYVDDVLTDGLRLTHDRLAAFALKTDSASRAFINFCNGINVLFDEPINDKVLTELNDPKALFDRMIREFVDANAAPLPNMQADKLAFIFSTALLSSPEGQKLKSLLFIACLLQIFGTSTAAVSQIVPALLEIIVQWLLAALPAVSDPGDPSVVSISADEIKKSFNSNSSDILYFIERFMVLIYSSMKNDDLGIIAGRTRYGGHSDTVLLMAAFDLLLNVVDRCSAQASSGYFFRAGTPYFIVRSTGTNAQLSIADVRSRLDKESLLLKQSSMLFINSLQSLRDGANSLISYVTTPSVVSTAATVSSIIGDDSLVNVLNDKQQIALLGSAVLDFTLEVNSLTNITATRSLSVNDDSTFDDADMFEVLDDGVISDKLKRAIFGFFSGPRYSSSSGINKRIISVGIPVGFGADLKKRSVLSSNRSNGAFSSKQVDIINVCVHRIDLQQQDIIFAPQKFSFELSRYPARVDALLPEFTTVADYTGKFPLRDFSQAVETRDGQTVQYLRPTAAQQRAFDGPSYGFLSDDQKTQIALNTVVSFLLETYVRLMTGLTIAEHELSLLPIENMLDDDKLEALIASNVQAASQKSSSTVSSTGTFFATSVITPSSDGTVAQSGTVTLADALGSLSQRILPVVSQQLVTIDELKRMITPLASRAKLLRRALAPRIFERVLNMIVDPDEFTVDVAKTNSTAQGKDALARSVSSGDLVSDSSGALRQRQRTQVDFALETYFVTIETVEPPDNSSVSSIFNSNFLVPKSKRKS